jgi:predicted RNA-binding Zn-ribbon protein involved in translation (DUF1610 family)
MSRKKKTTYTKKPDNRAVFVKKFVYTEKESVRYLCPNCGKLQLIVTECSNLGYTGAKVPPCKNCYIKTGFYKPF